MKLHSPIDSSFGQADTRAAEDAAPAYGELPNRLLTAFEVAEFVGCPEQTVRRAYLRGLLVSQRFGVRGRRFHPTDVLDWIFKAAYRQGREVATVNRALSTRRAAITWGRFQDPPHLTTTPFHRLGVTIRTKGETKRDRRVGLDEERTGHQGVGSAMHDRVIGALETCCRQGERRKAMTGVWERRRQLRAVGE